MKCLFSVDDYLKNYLYLKSLLTYALRGAQVCFKLLSFFWRIKYQNMKLFPKTYHIFSSILGSNQKHSKKHGDKWYKVIEHNMNANDCCSDLDDENELTDEEDLNNNNVNNQSLLSAYKSNENASTAHSYCARDFFDCLRFRRNYKRNRKKYGNGKGQSVCPIE